VLSITPDAPPPGEVFDLKPTRSREAVQIKAERDHQFKSKERKDVGRFSCELIGAWLRISLRARLQ